MIPKQGRPKYILTHIKIQALQIWTENISTQWAYVGLIVLFISLFCFCYENWFPGVVSEGNHKFMINKILQNILEDKRLILKTTRKNTVKWISSDS